ncbi:MAG: hypothetical protein KA436_03180 [Oligoflexales bacterium]|nr:hypothetical protein [Oligoflexales bacterium]
MKKVLLLSNFIVLLFALSCRTDRQQSDNTIGSQIALELKAECTAKAKTLRALIKKSGSCNTDSDCTSTPVTCGFTACNGDPVNKGFDSAAIATYYDECLKQAGPKACACAPREVTCVENVCTRAEESGSSQDDDCEAQGGTLRTLIASSGACKTVADCTRTPIVCGFTACNGDPVNKTFDSEALNTYYSACLAKEGTKACACAPKELACVKSVCVYAP